jgi:subtilisin family serine protease
LLQTIQTNIMLRSLSLSLVISTLGFAQNFSIRCLLNNNLDIHQIDSLFQVSVARQSFSDLQIRFTYPNAQNPELHKYLIVQGNEGNPLHLITTLLNTGVFQDVKMDDLASINLCTNPLPPVNDLWIANNWVNNDALTLVDARCAWSITTGDPNISIGIADTEFENLHEDLINQVYQINGPNSSNHYHGTRVFGVAGAQTNNNLGIAGIGYNCKGALERISHSSNGSAWSGNIETAIWNLYTDSIPVINVSWTGTGLDLLAAEEIAEHSVIVLAAGNTPNGSNHSAIADIPGVVLVSGVDHTGAHGPTGHRHNQWVDLCAQSTNVTTTDISNGYTGDWGTSYAAPMVSGTIGLMLSVNDCLSQSK